MKITFPHMGNAWIVFKTMFESLDIDVVVPPPNSKRTLNLGTKIAPESACLPLKLNLGNYIEAAAQGADTILITGGIGPCRFGYYGELEKEILRDAGYPFDVVILEPPDGSLLGLAKRIKYLAGRNSWGKILKTINLTYQKMVALDRVEDLIHGARAWLDKPTDTEKIYDEAKAKLLHASSLAQFQHVVRWVQGEIRERMQESGKRKDRSHPLKIGIVGEIYTILDPFSSLDIEKELGYQRVHVDRSIYLSGWVAKHVFQGFAQGYRSMKSYSRLANPYLSHFVGGHGQETVGAAIKFAREGYDGVIQLLPLTCMPEIVAASILPRVQEAYKIPIMTLIVDEHTGRAGLQTRLEAFIDLIERSKLKQDNVPTRKEVLTLAGK